MSISLWAALITLIAVDSPLVPGQPDESLVLSAVRSYRSEQRRTDVNAFVQVPYAFLEATGDSGAGALSFRVSVRVIDSTGLTLFQQAWQNHAPAELRRPGAYAVDLVRFSLAPGRYRLEVEVRDSVSGREAASHVEVEGFASTPPASDLVLSPRIRPAMGGDTVPRPAELRWGPMLVTASAHLLLTPLRPIAFYLLEAYSREQTNGSLNFRVVDSAGKALVTTAPIRVEVPAGGGVLKGQLDLDGLPPGRYTLVASLALREATVLRSAGFTMAELDETLEKDVVRREAAMSTDEGYFASLNGEQLDSALEPLTVVAERSELRGYSAELSPNAKRRFLTDFWRRQDPTPATPDNPAREVFYRGVAYANKNFREGGRTRQGWKSDRGRIFLRNGPPEEILQRLQPQGEAPPYEVWRYRTGKDRWYCFADRSQGVGLFQLIHSSDIREQGVPNWGEILGPLAMQDVGRFLGIDFFDGIHQY